MDFTGFGPGLNWILRGLPSTPANGMFSGICPENLLELTVCKLGAL